MADLMQLLQNQASGALVEQLAGQFLGGNKNQGSDAIQGAMSMLMGAMAKNASTPQGASSLASALDRDHDGSILDDVMGFLGGAKQPQNTKMLNGAGILNHVLGQRQETAADALAGKFNMDKSQALNLLMQLAPVVMGMLGKVKKQNNLDGDGLARVLQTTSQTVKKQNSMAGDLLTSVLDRDGDGSIMDDVAQSGIKAIFGKLFGRRR